jgi:hypothetical protein
MYSDTSKEQKIYFGSEEHRERFKEAIQRMEDRATWSGGQRLDQEYSAALHLLTADEVIWEKAQAFFTPVGIGFAKMIKGVHLSTTEMAMIRLAGNLFGQQIKANPLDLIDLDDRNFAVAIQALQLRRRPANRADIEA